MTGAAGRSHWMRLARLAAIAIGAIILCSCRSLSHPRPASASHAAACPPAAAAPAACPPQAALPLCVPPPVARPCPICDGGDGGAAARPLGEDSIGNLTEGDTVARFHAADDGPDADEVHLAVANCTCVYAPKFASVRQVSLPSERAAPLGLRGLAQDDLVAADARVDPVIDRTHVAAPNAARRAEPGIAVEERLAAAAVGQDDLPVAAAQRERPEARTADDQPLLTGRVQTPRQMIGFDVPLAWTCVKAANVLMGEQTAQVVAVDRGTATLRFEEPGRAELTLCKKAGSDTARVGEELDFTIFMLNSGDRALADIVLVDALPARLELVPNSADASLPADISTTRADDGAVVLEWRLREPLPAGGSGFVRFRTIVR